MATVLLILCMRGFRRAHIRAAILYGIYEPQMLSCVSRGKSKTSISQSCETIGLVDNIADNASKLLRGRRRAQNP